MRMATSDNALAERAAGGDRDAFRVLLERHYDRMYRLAYRYCGRHADAEDITQDICLALPAKLRSFKGSAQFTTWLYLRHFEEYESPSEQAPLTCRVLARRTSSASCTI